MAMNKKEKKAFDELLTKWLVMKKQQEWQDTMR
jgi:hypothetical protein